jgi:uncharacterized protein (TIGR02145 family)
MKKLMFSWTLVLAVAGLTFMSCGKDKDDDNKPTPTSFKDPRDQKTYKLVTISGQTWFAENLNYDIPGSSVCANDSCAKYGRVYTGSVAKIVCPQGYHLPTDAEWRTLEHNLGMSDEDTAKVGWYTRGVNEAIGISLANGGRSGFNALLFGDETYFWASDVPKNFPEFQYYRGLKVKDPSVYRSFIGGGSSTAKLCVRCLKN